MRHDIVNSIPTAPVLDRREFFVTSILAAGTFAAAVQPIQASEDAWAKLLAWFKKNGAA